MGCSQSGGCAGPKKRQPEKPKGPVNKKLPQPKPAAIVVEENPMDKLLSSNAAPSQAPRISNRGGKVSPRSKKKKT